MSNPKVSVVIPAYNAEKTIQSTIESVLRQDYDNFEVIVIDDGSIDKTVAKVWQMRKQFNHKSVVLHLITQKNAGVSDARNRGVGEATGEYIAFLDADDEWHVNKLSQHVSFLEEHKNVGLSFARVNYFTLSGKQRKASPYLSGVLQIHDVVDSNPTVSPSNWVLRKSIFKQMDGFRLAMTHAEDQEFLIRLIAETDSHAKCINSVLVNYANSGDGLSSDIHSMYEGWVQMMQSLRSTNNAQIFKHYDKYHHKYCLFLAKRNCQVKGHSPVGWKYFSKSISVKSLCQPSYAKSIVPVFLGLMINTGRQLMQSIISAEASTHERKVSVKPSTSEVNHV